jgi:hypothetical protein
VNSCHNDFEDAYEYSVELDRSGSIQDKGFVKRAVRLYVEFCPAVIEDQVEPPEGIIAQNPVRSLLSGSDGRLRKSCRHIMENETPNPKTRDAAELAADVTIQASAQIFFRQSFRK